MNNFLLIERVCLGLQKLVQWKVLLTQYLCKSQSILKYWGLGAILPEILNLIDLKIKNAISTRSHEVQKILLKISRLAEILILELSLFHADIVKGKNEFLKRSCLTLIGRILLLRLVLWNRFKWSSKLSKYERDFLLSILKFSLNEFLNCRDSKPNYSYIFFIWSTSSCTSFCQTNIILNRFKLFMKTGIIFA